MELSTEKNRLEKISQSLLINGTLVNDPGLWYGKMGVAIFFFHYANRTDNDLYQDYAMELIEEIQKQVTVTYSARYDVGLAGIGVGFEYLIQHDFLEADSNDILSEFDDRMYRAAMYEPYPDLSLAEGLTGWGRYFIYRLRHNNSTGNTQRLHQALARIIHEIGQKNIGEKEQVDVSRFVKEVQCLPTYTNVPIKVQDVNTLEEIKEIKETPSVFDMSLLTGYAGAGLRLLSAIGYSDDSWKQLL